MLGCCQPSLLLLASYIVGYGFLLLLHPWRIFLRRLSALLATFPLQFWLCGIVEQEARLRLGERLVTEKERTGLDVVVFHNSEASRQT